MALTSFYSANLILDSGTGAGRKIVRMSDVEIEEDNKNVLIGFHAFARCEFTSHFVIFPQGENNKLEKNEQQISF